VQGRRERQPHGYKKKKNTMNGRGSCSGSTSIAKVSTNQRARSVAQQRRFAVNNYSEWVAHALKVDQPISLPHPISRPKDSYIFMTASSKTILKMVEWQNDK
jgi:hypothetical protein